MNELPMKSTAGPGVAAHAAPTAAARQRGEHGLGYLSLFTSLGTLLCCALPSLLVLVGLGATVASALSAAPWLVTLSHHRQWVFLTAGILMTINFFYVYRWAPRMKAAGAACEPGTNGGDSACGRTSRLSRWLLWIAAAIYLVGFSTAYILAPILGRLAA
jgi:mercuric ion transport protein